MKILLVKNQFKFARYDDSYTDFLTDHMNLWLSA